MKVRTNTFVSEEVDVFIEGTKCLIGRAPVKGEFEFTLMKDGKVIDTAINREDHTFAFDMLTFNNKYEPEKPDEPGCPNCPDWPDCPDWPNCPDCPDCPENPDDSEDPESNVPETGDNSNMGMWFTLLMAAITGIFGTITFKKRQK